MATGNESLRVTRHSTETDVTEESRPDETLRHQTQLLANVNDAVVAVDKNFIWTSWGPAAERMYGWKEEEVIGRPMGQILHPEFVGIAAVEVYRAIWETGYWRGEVIQYTKDGEKIYTEANAFALRDENGDITGYVGVDRDISERKRAEEEVAGSLRQYQDLVESLEAIVWEINASDFRFTFVSKQSERMLGYSPKRWLAELTWQDLVHPDDLDHVFAICGKAIEEGRDHDLEYRMIAADGGVVWVRDIATLVANGDGPVKVRGVLLDITARKQADEALQNAHGELEMRVQERTADLTSANVQLQREISERKRAEEALRLHSEMMKHIAEAVYLVRASDGVIVYTNPAFEKLFGYDPGEMDGKHVSVVNAPTDKSPEETAKEIIAALDRTGVWSGEVHNIQKDGTPFWCYANVSTFDHAQYGQVWVTYHTDITERKLAEESLRQSEERFRQLAENVAEVSWLIDNRDDYQVLYVSPAYETIWGRSCKSLYDEPSSWLDAVHPGDRERVSAANETLIEHGELDQEYRVVQPDGTVRYVWDRGFPLRDESGEVYRLAGVVVDITERKRAEETLQVARDELEGKVERQLLRRNPYGLTFRELTVLHLVAAGKSDKEIGLELGISPLTASKHLSNILAKMGAGSRTEATARALREGLLD